MDSRLSVITYYLLLITYYLLLMWRHPLRGMAPAFFGIYPFLQSHRSAASWRKGRRSTGKLKVCGRPQLLFHGKKGTMILFIRNHFISGMEHEGGLLYELRFHDRQR